MAKNIEDKERNSYKERLKQFMQEINPKPTLEEVEQLRKHYLTKRVK